MFMFAVETLMSWQRGVYLHCKLQGVQSERVVVVGKLGEEPTMRGDKTLSDMFGSKL